MIETPALALFLLFDIGVSAQTAISQFADPTGKFSTTSSGSCACRISNASNVADNDLSNNGTIVMAANFPGASRGIRALFSLVTYIFYNLLYGQKHNTGWYTCRH